MILAIRIVALSASDAFHRPRKPPSPFNLSSCCQCSPISPRPARSLHHLDGLSTMTSFSPVFDQPIDFENLLCSEGPHDFTVIRYPLHKQHAKTSPAYCPFHISPNNSGLLPSPHQPRFSLHHRGREAPNAIMSVPTRSTAAEKAPEQGPAIPTGRSTSSKAQAAPAATSAQPSVSVRSGRFG